jgi:hypothetical protein
MKSRRLTTAAILCPAGQALGHSYATYASTPVTPPLEFRWWFPIAVLILLGSACFAIRSVTGQSWRTVAPRAVIVVVLFGVSFFLFGSCAALATTAPLPGLGLPHPTYWGLGWKESGGTFLFWNLIGLGLLLTSFRMLAGKKTWKLGRLKFVAIGSVAYSVALMPYMISGAYVHGWAGGYVNMACAHKRNKLIEAVFRYAQEHEQRLPAAQDIDGLIQALQPFLEAERSWSWRFPPAICPFGGAFERNPRKYQWNSDFARRSLGDIDPDKLMDEWLIACPYHQRKGSQNLPRILRNLDTAMAPP